MTSKTRETELGDIGTEILFENDRIRVWDMVLEPGESSRMHRHLQDYVWIDVGHSKKELLWPGERRLLSHDDGYVSYQVVGKAGRDYDTGIKNIGESRSRQVVIEFLGESASDEPRAPETNLRQSVEFPDGKPSNVRFVGGR